MRKITNTRVVIDPELKKKLASMARHEKLGEEKVEQHRQRQWDEANEGDWPYVDYDEIPHGDD